MTASSIDDIRDRFERFARCVDGDCTSHRIAVAPAQDTTRGDAPPPDGGGGRSHGRGAVGRGVLIGAFRALMVFGGGACGGGGALIALYFALVLDAAVLVSAASPVLSRVPT